MDWRYEVSATSRSSSCCSASFQKWRSLRGLVLLAADDGSMRGSGGSSGSGRGGKGPAAAMCCARIAGSMGGGNVKAGVPLAVPPSAGRPSAAPVAAPVAAGKPGRNGRAGRLGCWKVAAGATAPGATGVGCSVLVAGSMWKDIGGSCRGRLGQKRVVRQG